MRTFRAVFSPLRASRHVLSRARSALRPVALFLERSPMRQREALPPAFPLPAKARFPFLLHAHVLRQRSSRLHGTLPLRCLSLYSPNPRAFFPLLPQSLRLLPFSCASHRSCEGPACTGSATRL